MWLCAGTRAATLCGSAHLCLTCLIYLWHATSMRDVTYSYCNMPHSRATWLVHLRNDAFMCDMTHSFVTSSHALMDTGSWTAAQRGSAHSYVTWLIHVVTWLIYYSFICDMTLSFVTLLIHVWHGFIHVLIQVHGLPLLSGLHIHMWHDSFMLW